MKIEQSTVAMSSTHNVSIESQKAETLNMRTGNIVSGSENQKALKDKTPLVYLDIVDISDEAKKLQLNSKNGLVEEVKQGDTIDLSISEEDKQKLLLLQNFLEKLTGKKMRFYILDKIKIKSADSQYLARSAVRSSTIQKQGWGIEYNSHESYTEKETMAFESKGIIKTTDGREIDFSVKLNMSREFTYLQDLHFTAGDAPAVDPLVINFKGTPPNLTNNKFSFDLDSDGKPDQVSILSPGSGLLALDINNDGIINNGNELFGPGTGDGFGELQKYDFDENGWIDESDPVFDKLRIWVKDEDGNNRLFALGEKGIGAIYLGNINTPFDIKDTNNALLGQIRKSGIFIGENGSPGTIQHIDMAI